MRAFDRLLALLRSYFRSPIEDACEFDHAFDIASVQPDRLETVARNAGV